MGEPTVEGWPERWFGWYWVPSLAPDTVANVIGTVSNLQLSEGSVVWQQLQCTPETKNDNISVVFTDGAVAFSPSDSRWLGVNNAASAILRPTETLDCTELDLVFLDEDSQEIGVTTILRGRQFVFDDCSEDSEWGISLDPKVSMHCE